MWRGDPMDTFNFTLKVRGPFLTTGVGVQRIGLDAVQARDGQGCPIIRGTHVKGRLRFAILQLMLAYDSAIYGLDATLIEKKDERITSWEICLGTLFGNPDSSPSPVIFNDLSMVETQPLSKARRIAISRDTQTVQEGALAFLETSSPGRESAWKGEILLPSEGVGLLTLEDLRSLLAYGFLWLEDLGALNNVGWGKIVSREMPPPATSIKELADKVQKLAIKESTRTVPTFSADPPCCGDTVRTGLAMRLRSPLLVADHSTKGNFFQGRDDIPGSVIKRALADALLAALGRPAGGMVDTGLLKTTGADEYKDLINGFSGLTVRFALPAYPPSLQKGGDIYPPVGRPRVLPITAFAYKGWNRKDDGGPWDILAGELQRDDFLATFKGRRVALKCDAEALSGWQQDPAGPLFAPNHFIHTRTAVAPFTLAAEEGRLFSYRAVNNIYLEDGQSFDQVFLTEFVYPRQEAVTKQLLNLLGMVIGVGKASRHGLGKVDFEEVTIKEDDWKKRLDAFNSGPAACPGQFLVPIMLATEAVLLRPFAGSINADLTASYEESWRAVLGSDVNVVRFYAQHKLRGIRKGREGVPPVVLTEAGSVFVLAFPKEHKKDVEEALAPFATWGVEIPGHVKAIEERWGFFCPYRRTNGYGEIVVCHPIHTDGVCDEE